MESSSSSPLLIIRTCAVDKAPGDSWTFSTLSCFILLTHIIQLLFPSVIKPVKTVLHALFGLKKKVVFKM